MAIVGSKRATKASGSKDLCGFSRKNTVMYTDNPDKPKAMFPKG